MSGRQGGVSLRRLAGSGVVWSGTSQVGRQTMQFVTTAVLARLLFPGDFGIMGMATVVTGFVLIFKDLGTSAAIIQRKELTDELVSSVFWLNCVFGVLVSLLVLGLAPLIAAAYDEPRVADLLRVLSISFVVAGLSNLQQALLERQLAFRVLARIELAATGCGSVSGITAAVAGLGVWSLVIQSLTVSAVTTGLLWCASSWRPRLQCRWSALREVVWYSASLTGFTVVNYFARNADTVIIGRLLGASTLGYYALAHRLLLLPLQLLTSVVSRVSFPLLSSIQTDHARFRRAFLVMVSMIALVTAPMMLGLWSLARETVHTVFGPKWEPAVVLIWILAPIGMIQSFVSPIGTIYQSKGRTDLQLYWGLVASGVIVASYLIGSKWGMVGVASAYAVANIVLLLPTLLIPFGLIELRLVEFGRAVSRPIVYALVMSLVVLAIRQMLGPHVGHMATLVLGVVAGASVYVMLVWRFDREDLQALTASLMPAGAVNSSAGSSERLIDAHDEHGGRVTDERA